MEVISIQNRQITPTTIETINSAISANPNWNRTRLSKALCRLWNWRNDKGQIKDMACRTMLRKLESIGHIKLPRPQHSGNNNFRNKSFQFVLHSKSSICAKLRNIIPLRIFPVENKGDLALFRTFLSLYHYLGYSGAVGENIKYLVFDNNERPLACLLFGSAAWKVESRDKFIGWDIRFREQNLQFITNNMRFLILPWVRVKFLASHILGKIICRIRQDWTEKYAHPVHMLETFVECVRFKGTCYKAANWIYAGQTKGRSKQDRYHNLSVPIKDIYLYPFIQNFRQTLCR